MIERFHEPEEHPTSNIVMAARIIAHFGAFEEFDRWTFDFSFGSWSRPAVRGEQRNPLKLMPPTTSGQARRPPSMGGGSGIVGGFGPSALRGKRFPFAAAFHLRRRCQSIARQQFTPESCRRRIRGHTPFLIGAITRISVPCQICVRVQRPFFALSVC